MKELPWILVIAVVFIGAVVMLGDKSPAPSPGPVPVVPNGPVVVPGELSTLVATLQPYPAQKAQLASFYAAWKLAIERTDELKTTGQFAKAHRSSLLAFVGSTGYAGAPPVGNGIDVYLSQQVTGKADFPDTALDAAAKAKLVSALDTVARSLGG